MHHHILIGGLGIAVAAASLSAAPTDNPITKFYPGLSQYDWTDQLKWENVVTTAAVADDGNDDLATVQAEIDNLSAAGGGVLYFPAGTYDFSDDLYLDDGVVLRGVQPGDGYVADNLDPDRDPANPVAEVDNAKSSLFTLETKFNFPKFTLNKADPQDPKTAFKRIGTRDLRTDSNLGVVWVDVNRARIEIMEYSRHPDTGIAVGYWGYFGIPWDSNNPTVAWDDSLTWLENLEAGANYWRELRNRNIVVFGNRSNNAADWDNRSNSPPHGDRDFEAWQIWPRRFAANIDVFAYENVLIANNQLNYQHYSDWDNSAPNGEQPGDSIDTFLMTDYKDRNGNAINGDDGLWFRYTSGYGIKLNRSIGLGRIPFTPDENPFLYRKGFAVRDNWVFLTVRVAFFVGGEGIEIVGNYREDVTLSDDRKQMWAKPDGRSRQTNNSATYENRGYDITGVDLLFHKNYWNIQRGRISGGSYLTIDGEGVLHQEVGGGSIIDDWTITDNVGDAYIGLYKARDMEDVYIARNTLSAGVIYVQADTNGPTFYQLEDIVIEDNDTPGARVIGGLGIKDVVVRNNDFTGGTVLISDGVEYTGNTPAVPDTIEPTQVFNALPDVEVTAPADGDVVAPGSSLTLTVVASDDPEGAPTCVEVYYELTKIADATPTGNANEYSATVTVPSDVGDLAYYWVKACGEPHAWYAGICVRIGEGGDDPCEAAIPTVYMVRDLDAGTVTLKFATETGVNYHIYSQPTPTGVGGTYEATVSGDGSEMTMPMSTSEDRMFFYLEVDCD